MATSTVARVRQLLTDKDRPGPMIAAILVAEMALTAAIIFRIPCTNVRRAAVPMR